MSLTRKVTHAVSWQVLARGSDRGLRFLSSLLLARLLAPEDFGRLAGALVIASIVETISFLGVEQAIIKSDRGADPRFLGAAFRVMVVRGIVVALVVAACSPLGAWYYEEQALTAMTMVVALSPLVLGFANPWISSLRRDLDFRAYSVAAVTGGVAQVAVSVLLAWLGLGAMSLVIGIVANSATTVAAGWLLVPRRIDLAFDPEARAEIRSFAGKAVGMPFLLLLSLELPGVVLGRVTDLATLGTFTLARRLCSLPTEVALPIFASVLTPAYASLRGEPERLRRVWLFALASVPMLTLPVVAGTVVLDERLPRVLYGAEYAGAAGLMSLLGVANFVNAINGCCGPLFWGLGVPQRDRTQVAIRLVVVAVLSVPAARVWGVVGVAGAIAVAQVLSLMYALGHARALAGCSWGDVLRAMRGPALLGGSTLALASATDSVAARFGGGDLVSIAATSSVVVGGMLLGAIAIRRGKGRLA